MKGSFTGTRVKGMAFMPRVARIMERTVSRVSGLCSISIQRKSNPLLASVAATSGLVAVMVAPMTGRPSFKASFTGFWNAVWACELATSQGNINRKQKHTFRLSDIDNLRHGVATGLEKHYPN